VGHDPALAAELNYFQMLWGERIQAPLDRYGTAREWIRESRLSVERQVSVGGRKIACEIAAPLFVDPLL
jgi:hypothetical protein